MCYTKAERRNTQPKGGFHVGQMKNDDLPKIIAKNITELRRNAGLTQAKLAEEIGYSDKSVSKWERCEGVPDVVCLKNMADLFGVTVDYFLTDEHGDSAIPSGKPSSGGEKPGESPAYTVNRAAIFGVILAGCAFVSALVYVILRLCGVATALPFVIALPVFALLCVIFNGIWGWTRLHFWTVTLLIWSVLFMCAYVLGGRWLILLLGLPGTLITWLACRVKVKAVEKPSVSENNDENPA